MKHLTFLIIIAISITSCEQIQNSLDSAFGNKEKPEKTKEVNIYKNDFSSIKNETLETYNNENNLLQTPCYVVCVSAHKDIDEAIHKAQKIRNNGYNADYLYLPDYASLSKKLYYSTYVGPVFSEAECQNLVRQVRRDYRGAYGILVSDDPEWRITIRPEGIKRRRY